MGIASAPAALPLYSERNHLYMTAFIRAPEPGFEHQTMPTAVGPEGRRQKRKSRNQAGAFTAADLQRKFLPATPAGNSSRSIR